LGKFLKKGSKFRTRDPARGWFYINPSRRGPVPGFRGGLKRGVFGLQEASEVWGPGQGPGATFAVPGVPEGPQGPAARG